MRVSTETIVPKVENATGQVALAVNGTCLYDPDPGYAYLATPATVPYRIAAKVYRICTGLSCPPNNKLAVTVGNEC